jgi:hypothetical protein
MSQAARPSKRHDQIARKLRVGALETKNRGTEFYFILLDLAPIEKLRGMRPGASLEDARKAKASGFGSKWLTAFWFARYKFGWKGSLAPLKNVLADSPAIEGAGAEQIAHNMGWLTWADVFKAVLRAVVADQGASLHD